MNEQQRKEMSHIQQGDSTDKTAVHEKPLYEKTSADFAKYFETTYEPPNINKSRKRGRDDIEVHYDFTIAEDMRNIGQDKKFLIRTYGCQMNDHDTEVMAGILSEMGYELKYDTNDEDIFMLKTLIIIDNSSS